MVGFNVREKNVLSTEFSCPACSWILRDPLQFSTCGHRCCQSCVHADEQTQLIRCPQCQVETPIVQVKLDHAFNSRVQSLPITCILCQWTDLLSNYQVHLEQTHSTPQCPQCGEQCSSMHEFNRHTQLSCPTRSTSCLLKEWGCHRPINRSALLDHYRSLEHQQSVARLAARDAQMTTTTMETDLQSQLIGDELSSVTLAFHLGTQIISEDLQRMNGESIDLLNRVRSVSDSVSTMTIAGEEQSASSEATSYSTMMLEQEIKSIKETVDDRRHVSYDGTLVWRITGVKEKMRDAESERQTSVYSPPFYSSPTGYKMRARLYLNGDGNARRTHMSLFFVLMRGPNDAILKFPFNYKVTFCLYDQTPQQRHIIDSFRPDIKSNSFQRPRSEMNIASGIPKFFPLATIQQEGNPYLREDTMFIKIMVDFCDLPKTVLPYMLSLNPGLPMSVQQRFIQEKIGKRGEE